MSRRRNLSGDEVARMVGDMPPVIDVHQAARMVHLSSNTIYKHVSLGRYRSAVRRGKPLRFITERFVREFWAEMD